jgi:hypothetical protein
LLNREFEAHREAEERAAGPLSGGILQQGHHCGMLWGVSLATGAEAYRSCAHLSQAIAVSIEATRSLMHSFEEEADTTLCRQITGCDFNSKLSYTKYLLSGKFLQCFKLAQSWAPKAVRTAKHALGNRPYNFEHAMSCASEVVRKMGGSEEEMCMVAGFAGGLGLSGGGCGALSAAIWMNSLQYCRDNEKASGYNSTEGKELLKVFRNFSGGKMDCHEISQRRFVNVSAHTDYLKLGGCEDLINTLSKSRKK